MPFTRDTLYFRNITPLVEALRSGNSATAEDALNRYINWTPAAAQGLQESVLGASVYGVCLTDQSVGSYMSSVEYTFCIYKTVTVGSNHIIMQDVVISDRERLPDITCPYKAPDPCAAGATAMVGSVMTLLLLMALTILML